MSKYFLCSSLLFLLGGCFDTKDKNVLDQLILNTPKNRYVLTIPHGYHVAPLDGSHVLNIHVIYPSMLPTSQLGFEENRMLIQISSLLFNEAQYALRDTTESPYMHYLGKQDLYEVYGDDTEANRKATSGLDISHSPLFSTHFFIAEDKQLVSIHRSYSDDFQVRRNISRDVGIRYQFRRTLGTDFIAIDKDVMRFVNNHLKPYPISPKENTK